MKQLLTLTILTILISLGLTSLTLSPAYAANEDLKNTTFNVKDLLQAEGQEQSYFEEQYFDDEEAYSPIEIIIVRVIEFATRIIGSLALILIIISGFIYMFSQGDQQNLDKAKDIAVYAVIGLLVTFLSFIVTLAVQSLFLL
ncbi:pilin [Patescibacteria group bacterium]|nr:pilin [Patescibacteria group bacterium]